MHHALKLAETKRQSNSDALQRARGLLVRFQLGRNNADVELDDDEFYEFLYLAGVYHEITAQWHPNSARLGAFLDLLMSEHALRDESKVIDASGK